MTDHDDVLGELETALNVEPSAAFANGVRSRIATSRARARGVWWGLAAAASVGLAAAMLWQPAMVTPSEVAPVTVVQSEAPQRAPVATPQPSAVVPPPMAVIARAPRATTASAAMPASEPRLEVITNQGAVLRALWADVDAHLMPETVVEPAVPVTPPAMDSIAPIVVDPIVVALVVVSELGSIGERSGAAPIIRRNDAAGNLR